MLGPDATLRRGYSITINDRGQIIRTTTEVVDSSSTNAVSFLSLRKTKRFRRGDVRLQFRSFAPEDH